MVRYDPEIIQKFAEKLYAQANRIIFVYTALGALAGAVAGLAISQNFDQQTQLVAVLAVAGLLGLIGFVIGSERAFRLKLEAQLALCQMRIEWNTRPRTAAAPTAANPLYNIQA